MKTSYYITMFDELDRQGHFKVMEIVDLDVVMTLKPNMLQLAFQELACILISPLASLNTLKFPAFKIKIFVTLTLIHFVFIKFVTFFDYAASIFAKCWHIGIIL